MASVSRARDHGGTCGYKRRGACSEARRGGTYRGSMEERMRGTCRKRRIAGSVHDPVSVMSSPRDGEAGTGGKCAHGRSPGRSGYSFLTAGSGTSGAGLGAGRKAACSGGRPGKASGANRAGHCLRSGRESEKKKAAPQGKRRLQVMPCTPGEMEIRLSFQAGRRQECRGRGSRPPRSGTPWRADG